MKNVRLRKIGAFLLGWVRALVARRDLESAYARMAKDDPREKEALEWVEATFKGRTKERR